MTTPTAKRTRAVALFEQGHSCRYVAKVLHESYARTVTLRNGLDLPDYDMRADPSLGRTRAWSSLVPKPQIGQHRVGTRPMTPAFHVKRCRFPLWPHDKMPDQSFCGDYVQTGSSYCPPHHKVCYVAGSERVFPSMPHVPWDVSGPRKRKRLAKRR